MLRLSLHKQNVMIYEFDPSMNTFPLLEIWMKHHKYHLQVEML